MTIAGAQPAAALRQAPRVVDTASLTTILIRDWVGVVHDQPGWPTNRSLLTFFYF